MASTSTGTHCQCGRARFPLPDRRLPAGSLPPTSNKRPRTDSSDAADVRDVTDVFNMTPSQIYLPDLLAINKGELAHSYSPARLHEQGGFGLDPANPLPAVGTVPIYDYRRAPSTSHSMPGAESNQQPTTFFGGNPILAPKGLTDNERNGYLTAVQQLEDYFKQNPAECPPTVLSAPAASSASAAAGSTPSMAPSSAALPVLRSASVPGTGASHGGHDSSATASTRKRQKKPEPLTVETVNVDWPVETAPRGNGLNGQGWTRTNDTDYLLPAFGETLANMRLRSAVRSLSSDVWRAARLAERAAAYAIEPERADGIPGNFSAFMKTVLLPLINKTWPTATTNPDRAFDLRYALFSPYIFNALVLQPELRRLASTDDNAGVDMTVSMAMMMLQRVRHSVRTGVTSLTVH